MTTLSPEPILAVVGRHLIVISDRITQATQLHFECEMYTLRIFQSNIKLTADQSGLESRIRYSSQLARGSCWHALASRLKTKSELEKELWYEEVTDGFEEESDEGDEGEGVGDAEQPSSTMVAGAVVLAEAEV